MRPVTQTDMSVIYRCSLYILYNCLLIVTVFAPQFNVYCNCDFPPIPSGWNGILFHANFIMLPIHTNHSVQLPIYLHNLMLFSSLSHWSSNLLYFSNLMLFDDTA